MLRELCLVQVWDDAIKAKCQLDCRICTTLVEVCTRMGLTDRALSTYELMRTAPPNSKMAPTVHAYTAVMRAAAEGGKWERALSIWSDMEAARCAPSGNHFLPLLLFSSYPGYYTAVNSSQGL